MQALKSELLTKDEDGRMGLIQAWDKGYAGGAAALGMVGIWGLC